MLANQTFQIRPLPTLVFGVDSSLELAAQVKALGRSSALIVTDKGLMASGAATALLEKLAADGVQVEVFDGVAANPTDENVEAGALRLRVLGDAVVVALGGGSSMDCGKAIALLATNGDKVTDLQTRGRKEPGVPVIAVATTAGTGSETNSACVITNTALGRKTYVMHPSIVPVVSILDPKLTLGLPKYPTATCGFDVLTHAIEAFTSARTTPYSDAVALGAIQLVAQYVRTAVEDGSNLEARSQMLMASSMAAIAFNVSGLGAAHGTGHALSARLNAAHGQTLATMLPHVMAYNLEVCAAKYAQVAEAMGVATPGASTEDQARAAIAAVVALRDDIGITRSIRDLGGTDELLALLVGDAMADGVNLSNARPVDAQAIEALYRAAW
ncbi:iron-containing alcohol dehydrogenase family protein [Phenylobacterium sp.]|uniref:iron-containing alcohol dehydrogenase family protein n=1 Tax=Phenylobacterium sp. TaxID=1871053 RepID=UPI0027322575|nr:iron-containing alcohol dehydrogenase [Phenylobacterium sp.]MDP1875734.1 iron-containing alcohol dehydrogenase [Phenylobacterium sp.]